MSSSPVSLGPCHIQPHTITQGWADVEDKQAGGLGTREGRKEGGRHLGENQASPRRTLSKNRGHAVEPAREKPKRAHSTIAPPVCVSHTLKMWVHGRQFSVAPTPPFKLKSCPEGDISLTPPWLCCYSCPAKSHAAAFRNTSPADCGGPWATTRLSMGAVRWAAKEAQSQDRGTWRAQ